MVLHWKQTTRNLTQPSSPQTDCKKPSPTKFSAYRLQETHPNAMTWVGHYLTQIPPVPTEPPPIVGAGMHTFYETHTGLTNPPLWSCSRPSHMHGHRCAVGGDRHGYVRGILELLRIFFSQGHECLPQWRNPWSRSYSHWWRVGCVRGGLRPESR